MQYVAAGVVSGIASLSIGTVLGFSAILIPQLIDEGIIDSDKSTEASWIGRYSKILPFKNHFFSKFIRYTFINVQLNLLYYIFS